MTSLHSLKVAYICRDKLTWCVSFFTHLIAWLLSMAIVLLYKVLAVLNCFDLNITSKLKKNFTISSVNLGTNRFW